MPAITITQRKYLISGWTLVSGSDPDFSDGSGDIFAFLGCLALQLRNLGIMARIQISSDFLKKRRTGKIVFACPQRFAEIVSEGTMPRFADVGIGAGLVSPAAGPEDVMRNPLIQHHSVQTAVLPCFDLLEGL